MLFIVIFVSHPRVQDVETTVELKYHNLKIIIYATTKAAIIYTTRITTTTTEEESLDLYKIGTKDGTLAKLYSINKF